MEAEYIISDVRANVVPKVSNVVRVIDLNDVKFSRLNTYSMALEDKIQVFNRQEDRDTYIEQFSKRLGFTYQCVTSNLTI